MWLLLAPWQTSCPSLLYNNNTSRESEQFNARSILCTDRCFPFLLLFFFSFDNFKVKNRRLISTNIKFQITREESNCRWTLLRKQRSANVCVSYVCSKCVCVCACACVHVCTHTFVCWSYADFFASMKRGCDGERNRVKCACVSKRLNENIKERRIASHSVVFMKEKKKRIHIPYSALS